MRIAIVEDEKEFAKQLMNDLDRYGKESGVAMDVRWFTDGAQIVGDYRPEWDLILLDIDMPTMDGITTAKEIRRQDAGVLLMFVTNLAQYAIKGYEVEAVDYVLKPINYQAFKMKMNKVMRIYRNTQEEFVMLKKEGEIKRIPLSHIYYIEVTGHRMIYHTSEGIIEKSGEQTLTVLERELHDRGFARCNACYLVNLRFVDTITEQEIRVAGECLTVSRGKKKTFREELMEYARGH